MSTVSACAAFIAGTDVSLVSLRSEVASVNEGSVAVALEVVNHNTGDHTVVGMLYHVDVETAAGWEEVGEGFLVQGGSLPRGEPVSMDFEIPLDLSEVTADVRERLGSEGVRIQIRGELRVRGGYGEAPAPFSIIGVSGS